MLNKLTSFLKDAKRIVIIGMGNELRTDDGVGLEVVRLLKPYSDNRLQVFEAHMIPDAFIRPACKMNPTHLLIVDAAELHAKPGDWRLLSSDEVEEGLFTTHAIPVVEVASEIKRRCDSKVAFLGIQPKSRDISISLSQECQHSAKEIADSIHRIVTAKVK